MSYRQSQQIFKIVWNVDKLAWVNVILHISVEILREREREKNLSTEKPKR